MRVNGIWQGWGLGDNSTSDFTVRRAKAFMRDKFRSYAGHLADTNLFDREMENAVIEMQGRYLSVGRLVPGEYLPGVLDLKTQIVMGFRAAGPAVKPIIFTIEGHMSDMFRGPCAFTAQALEQQGVCHWQPVGYNSTKLPFDGSGRTELKRLLSLKELPRPNAPAIPFPAGTPWGLIIFSRGAIDGCETYQKDILPVSGSLHWRNNDLKRVLAFGNPCREQDVIAEWVTDPPHVGTQGISDVRMTKTPLTIWREVARTGDLYSENTTDERGLNKESIYRIVARNSWSGGPSGMLARVLDLFTNPFDGVIDIARSVIDGAMFVPNMGPHGMYDLGPCVAWMRGVGS